MNTGNDKHHHAHSDNRPKIAVLIPCYNEELTVAKVVADFREALPESEIFVFDNASTDRTSEKAKAAGATVVPSPRPGKGQVVQHMFETVDADWYLMVDGDATYPPGPAKEMLEIAQRDRYDMLVGKRVPIQRTPRCLPPATPKRQPPHLLDDRKNLPGFDLRYF